MNHVYELTPIRTRWRLGRGGMAYLAVTLVILSAAVYTQANLLFWALGLMAGGLVVSLMLMVASMRKLSVYRMLPNHGIADEPLILRYQIANRSKLAVFGLLVYETWGRSSRHWKKQGAVAQGLLGDRPSGWLLHIGPQQTLQAETLCWPRQRGLLNFERIVLESGFPFGVLHKVVEFAAPAEVLIYPRLFRIHRRLLLSLSHSDSMGNKQTDRGGGAEDFFGLRQYRPGDSIRLIDWKHTASTGQMVVRELTQPTLPQVMILLDLRPFHGSKDMAQDQAVSASEGSSLNDACEKAISLAASLVCDAYLNGYQIGLEVAGKSAAERFALHHSLPHRTRIIDMLAKLDYSMLSPHEPRTERATVIVRPGRVTSQPTPRRLAGRSLILGGDNLEQYVQHNEDRPTWYEPGGEVLAELLRRQAHTTPKRHRSERRFGSMKQQNKTSDG